MSDKTYVPPMVSDNYQDEEDFNDTLIARLTYGLILLIVIIILLGWLYGPSDIIDQKQP